MTGGLKNRGRTRADTEERRKAVEEFSDSKLDNISSFTFDPLLAEKNIENMIGAVQVPLGFVGPIKVNGDHAKGEFLVPMATTEGALLATVNRGCSALAVAGGANVFIVKDEMTRAPVFRVRNLKHGRETTAWIATHSMEIMKAAESTTKHGKLVGVRTFESGRSLFVRFSFETGDAMGMNMATIASEKAAKVIERGTGAKLISISGNVCVDKKPSGIDYILGRGKTVVADATLSADIVKEKLKTTPEQMAEAALRKDLVGSAMSLSLGQNAHVANMLAAVFIATGQDPAQVVEGSMGMTTAEVVDGDLYVSLRLPSLEVGTVGGGTKLPCQSEALSIMGCLGAGKARKFAEIVTAVTLAGELSTLAAQATGTLASAHQALGR
ncbi:MAG TPA: hydroxymethylglutaryl-CoA reductase (NADPH) [Methanomassiliicoccales archaeon]|nr:hydroxymethylglutaryl-CoA reductase (NADPH) [Methanomassiliicoccales archaeon]